MTGNPRKIRGAVGAAIERAHVVQDALARMQSDWAEFWKRREEPVEPPFMHPNITAMRNEANGIWMRSVQEEADRRVLAAASDAYAAEQAKVEARTAAHMSSMSDASVSANRRKGEASRQAVITAATDYLRDNPKATREETAAAIQPKIGTVQHDRITFYLKESGLFKARRPKRLGRFKK